METSYSSRDVQARDSGGAAANKHEIINSAGVTQHWIRRFELVAGVEAVKSTLMQRAAGGTTAEMHVTLMICKGQGAHALIELTCPKPQWESEHGVHSPRLQTDYFEICAGRVSQTGTWPICEYAHEYIDIFIDRGFGAVRNQLPLPQLQRNAGRKPARINHSNCESIGLNRRNALLQMSLEERMSEFRALLAGADYKPIAGRSNSSTTPPAPNLRGYFESLVGPQAEQLSVPRGCSAPVGNGDILPAPSGRRLESLNLDNGAWLQLFELRGGFEVRVSSSAGRGSQSFAFKVESPSFLLKRCRRRLISALKRMAEGINKDVGQAAIKAVQDIQKLSALQPSLWRRFVARCIGSTGFARPQVAFQHYPAQALAGVPEKLVELGGTLDGASRLSHQTEDNIDRLAFDCLEGRETILFEFRDRAAHEVSRCEFCLDKSGYGHVSFSNRLGGKFWLFLPTPCGAQFMLRDQEARCLDLLTLAAKSPLFTRHVASGWGSCKRENLPDSGREELWRAYEKLGELFDIVDSSGEGDADSASALTGTPRELPANELAGKRIPEVKAAYELLLPGSGMHPDSFLVISENGVELAEVKLASGERMSFRIAGEGGDFKIDDFLRELRKTSPNADANTGVFRYLADARGRVQ